MKCLTWEKSTTTNAHRHRTELDDRRGRRTERQDGWGSHGGRTRRMRAVRDTGQSKCKVWKTVPNKVTHLKYSMSTK